LLEGIVQDGDTRELAREGVSWLRQATQLDNAQAQYELGTLFYLGCVEAGIDVDEARAFALYERAAAQEHTSGLFMTAELLIEGAGCAPDPARAVPLLHAAAERGHRMARQYLREWLDEDAGA